MKIKIKNTLIVDKIMQLFEIDSISPIDVSLSSDKNKSLLLKKLKTLKQIFNTHSNKLSKSDINDLDTFFKVSLTVPPAMKF